MPSEKTARVQERKRTRNRLVRNATRTQIRKAQDSITSGDSTSTAEEVKKALSKLDKKIIIIDIHDKFADQSKLEKIGDLEYESLIPTFYHTALLNPLNLSQDFLGY